MKHSEIPQNLATLTDDEMQLWLQPIQTRHRLLPQVSVAFKSMQQQALDAGISMAIASSYRSIEQQLVIWNAKWRGERPLLSRTHQTLTATELNPQERLHAILVFSALPGASRHHWGTDLDVYDAPAIARTNQPLQLLAAEYQAGGPCAALKQWLDTNATRFGFYFPYQIDVGGVAAEPWHISYRPLAEDQSEHLTLDCLRSRISALPIEGKHTILEQLEYLYHRYVLNVGDQAQ